jgi:hypothetical protein
MKIAMITILMTTITMMLVAVLMLMMATLICEVHQEELESMNIYLHLFRVSAL